MELHKKGMMIVISGPSGAGKGTIIKFLFKRTIHDFCYSVSMTDRLPREKEEDGKDYFFVTKEEFQKKIKENYFLEYNKFINNYYGTPRQKILEDLKKGKKIILELDIQGALEIKNSELCEKSIFIFITPPSKKHLYKRLTKRNTENNEILKKRLQKADEELDAAYKYDYIIINDEIKSAVDKIISIIVAENYKTKNIISYYIENILKEKNK
ncbi:guanylate kinase [Candidatus Phytoplasma sacchari]|uniref:Guanylate kinase n=1 Tax=Candidatus Phytoplasma sacchari TaxID=2609813 RepID=A0ABY7M1N2_9MOLU|nr:guanylate kinase [Candidatus Phytoplasma sacchari]